MKCPRCGYELQDDLFGSTGNHAPAGNEPMTIDTEATLLAAWNDLAKRLRLPTVRRIDRSSTRAKAVKARLADPQWVESYPAALARIPHCPWLIGKNDRGWKIHFDFFCRPGKVDAILEGRYLNAKDGSIVHDEDAF